LLARYHPALKNLPFEILIKILYSTGADGADGRAAQADDHALEDGGQRRRHEDDTR